MDKLNQEITILIVTFLSKEIIENCLSKIDHNYSIVIVENSNDKDFLILHLFLQVTEDGAILILFYLHL